MLQLPDFQEKQIIFIRNEYKSLNQLRFKNDNIAFYKDDQIVNQVSCHKIFALFIEGDLSITSVLIRKVLQYGISIFFLRSNLETYAEIGAKIDGNYVLRFRQYHFEHDLLFAKNLVKNKCFNQLALLQEKDPKYFQKKSRSKTYKELCAKIDVVTAFDELLGIEGSFTRSFFASYFQELKWYRRMPRTKVDIPNFLLDVGYNLLFNFVDSLLRLHGFDTYKGIYHQLFFQRKSLSCDMMEPFRCLIEKALLKAYRLGQINEKDFKVLKGKYVVKPECNRKYVKIFLEVLMENKEVIFSYVKSFYFCMLNQKTDFPFYKYQ